MTLRAFKFAPPLCETDSDRRHSCLQFDVRQDAINQRNFERSIAQREPDPPVVATASTARTCAEPQVDDAFERLCAYVVKVTRRIVFRRFSILNLARALLGACVAAITSTAQSAEFAVSSAGMARPLQNYLGAAAESPMSAQPDALALLGAACLLAAWCAHRYGAAQQGMQRRTLI